MGLIIVEGSDGVGKSTFVEVMKETYTGKKEFLHFGPPSDPDPFVEYEHPFYSRAGQLTVCDRLHWGETVYGPLLRDRNRLDTASWRHVELFLAAQCAVVAYLHQPAPVLIDRLTQRGDDLIKIRDLATIDVGYQQCVRNTILPTLALRDPGRFEAEQLLALTGAGMLWDDWFRSYIGRLRPDGLLFGEMRNDPENTKDLSAFVPRPATSGRYLLSALPEDTWPLLGIANAMEEKADELWMELGEPPTVALGVKAHRELDRLQIPHATVPHPQFVRRFHHSEQENYGRLIRNLLGTKINRIDWRGDG